MQVVVVSSYHRGLFVRHVPGMAGGMMLVRTHRLNAVRVMPQ